MTPLDPRLQLPEKVVEALKAGNAVLAVKLLRELKGIGLKEARDILVAMRDRLPGADRQGLQDSKGAIDRIVPSLPARTRASGSKRPMGLAPGEVRRTDGVFWRVIVGIALTLLAYWYLSDG